MHIILMAAGAGRRLRNMGPISNLRIGNGTLLQTQIDHLEGVYPDAKINVVVGYKAEKIDRSQYPSVNFIYNKHFAITNVAHSLGLAIQHTEPHDCLFINGDVYFNHYAIPQTENTTSTVYHYPEQHHEIGCRLNKNNIFRFGYDLKPIWSQMFRLSGDALDRLCELATHEDNQNCFCFELLNVLLNEGFCVRHQENEKGIAIDIDYKKDLNLVNSLIQ